MRGTMQVERGVYPLSSALERMAEEKERAFLPEKFEASELAWNFEGQAKFLTDCTKEELLHVAQCLCRQIPPVDIDLCRITVY